MDFPSSKPQSFISACIPHTSSGGTCDEDVSPMLSQQSKQQDFQVCLHGRALHPLDIESKRFRCAFRSVAMGNRVATMSILQQALRQNPASPHRALVCRNPSVCSLALASARNRFGRISISSWSRSTGPLQAHSRAPKRINPKSQPLDVEPLLCGFHRNPLSKDLTLNSALNDKHLTLSL